WTEAALEETQQALILLDGSREEPSDPFCLPFPYTWDEFRVQYSILYTATRSTPDCFKLLRRCLLMHRGGMLLGKLAEEQGLEDLAMLGYRVAAAARPDLGMARIGLGRVLAGQARTAHANTAQAREALIHLEAGLQSDPFVSDAWQLAAEMQL